MTAAAKPATATLSGREIALMRRQAMALHGKSALGKPVAASVGQPDRAVATSRSGVAPAPVAARSVVPSAAPKNLALERRIALSRLGKSALPAPGAKTEAAGYAIRGRPAPAPKPPVVPACGCEAKPGTSDAHVCDCATPHIDKAAPEPAAGGVMRREVQPVGRAFARARRAALAQDGKAGLKRVAQATKIAASLPGQDWQAAITKGASGRQVAMQHRKVQALVGGSGANRAAARPSAHVRVKPAFMEVPAKVEEGHTLSGTAVTGTMVERSRKVTGNEPGSCRIVTGTEYVGFEQYGEICAVKVEPGPMKVRSSLTARDLTVTGTEIGSASRMTGIDYLPATMYDKFFPARPAIGPTKEGREQTARGKTISGTLVNRPSSATGGETGADRTITGTTYARLSPDTAPAKGAMTHTLAASPLTGTTLGRDTKVTGDEPGSCRAVTGSQYLSVEHFTDFCRTTAPQPTRKVSVMSTPGGQPVTGSDVGRARHVTGDEAGSCRAITGNQYFNASDFGALCNTGGPRKVAMIETRGGNGVSGTEVASSPKMSGDEAGRRRPITGIDYRSAAKSAVSGPDDTSRIEPIAKVSVDQTLNGKTVTGSAFGRSKQVTGDEHGACSPISGSSYIGRGQYQVFCAPESLLAQSGRVRDRATISATMVSGDRPGAGGNTMTGDERGACATITGAPYLGADNIALTCRGRAEIADRRQRVEPADKPAAPNDFSIHSPARVAWDASLDGRNGTDAVTGTGASGGAMDRITGPGNKASGWITGTPEFRHQVVAPVARGGLMAIDAAQADPKRSAPVQRLSGEAQIHDRVTGDAWKAQNRVSGTEGRSSIMRNPSQRGTPRGVIINARVAPDADRPPVANNLVTGSSGNTGRGPLVTVSGGARA